MVGVLPASNTPTLLPSAKPLAACMAPGQTACKALRLSFSGSRFGRSASQRLKRKNDSGCAVFMRAIYPLATTTAEKCGALTNCSALRSYATPKLRLASLSWAGGSSSCTSRRRISTAKSRLLTVV